MRNLKPLISVTIVSALIVSIFLLYANSNDLDEMSAVKIDLVESYQDFEIGVPQIEQLHVKNLANRSWQIEISEFDIWGSEGLDPLGTTLKWKLESVSQSFETIKTIEHEGLIANVDYQKIDLPSSYDGVLAFELTFNNASKGNYSRLLTIGIYDPQGEADVWQWQSTTNFEIK
jgi:hypothetical protein